MGLQTSAEEEVEGAEDGSVGADDADVYFGAGGKCLLVAALFCEGWEVGAYSRQATFEEMAHVRSGSVMAPERAVRTMQQTAVL